MNNPRTRNFIIYGFIGLMLLIIFIGINGGNQDSNEIKFTDLVTRIKSGDVTSIHVVGDQLLATMNDRSNVTTTKAPESTAQEQLTQFGVTTDEINRICWVCQNSS